MKQHCYTQKALQPNLTDIIATHFDASDALLNSFSTLVCKRLLSAGESLWREGDKQDKLYLLNKGLLYAWFNTIEGKSFCKEVYWETDLLFCFRSLLSGEPYPFSVTALEACELYELPRTAYLQWIETSSENLRFHLAVVSEYYLYKEGKEEFLLLNTPEKRVAEFYQTYPDLVARLPQHIVASYLGITPISFSRIKRRLNIEGHRGKQRSGV